MIHTPRILAGRILISRAPPILLSQQLLHLPIPLLRPHAELQIFLRDRVPVFIHHHDCQQITDRREEQPVQIVLRRLADLVAEDIEDHLPDDEEEDPEEYMQQRPAILQRVGHEDDLHDGVDEEEDAVEKIQHHEQAHRIRGAEPGFALEGQDRDGERDEEHADGAAAQQPDRLPRAVLVELEADEAVDQ